MGGGMQRDLLELVGMVERKMTVCRRSHGFPRGEGRAPHSLGSPLGGAGKNL